METHNIRYMTMNHDLAQGDAREQLILFAARDAIAKAINQVGQPANMDRIKTVMHILQTGSSFDVIEELLARDSPAPTQCLICPRPIPRPRSNKRFCSSKCRMRYHRGLRLAKIRLSADEVSTRDSDSGSEVERT